MADYKIVLLAIVAFILYQGWFLINCYSKNRNIPYEEINIEGEEKTNGVFDQSLEYKDQDNGYMVYSAINFPYVNTHIAVTHDGGKQWRYIGEINKSYPANLVVNGKEIKGYWINEVPTLVYVKDDIGKEWKLYWHKYVFKQKTTANNKFIRVLEYSYIAYKYAPSPYGPWSEEIRLFAAGHFPLPPYKCKINLNKLNKELENFLVYTEPGSLYYNGVLYLSLQGYTPKPRGLETKIFLLASYDKGKSWDYIGVLSENKDAQPFGYDFFTANSLVAVNGRVFILVTGQKEKERHYGTYIFEIEDIANAKLERDRQGNLVLYKFLPPSIITFNSGESDYDQYNKTGIIVSQLAPKATISPKNIGISNYTFKIYSTYQKLP